MKPPNPRYQNQLFFTRIAELNFKRWKDRRKSQDHFFIAFQCMVLALAVPFLIYKVIGILFFGR